MHTMFVEQIAKDIQGKETKSRRRGKCKILMKLSSQKRIMYEDTKNEYVLLE